MKKKKRIILLAVLLVVIVLTCGFLIYRGVVKSAVVKQCENYINSYVFDILPDEYRNDVNPDCIIPEDFINDKLSDIEDQYRELFTESEYISEVSKKKEWYRTKIITGEVILCDYAVEVKKIHSFRLDNFNEAEIFFVVSQKGIDKVKNGDSYIEEPFDADVGYRFFLKKSGDNWKIFKVHFASIM